MMEQASREWDDLSGRIADLLAAERQRSGDASEDTAALAKDRELLFSRAAALLADAPRQAPAAS